MLSTPTSFRRTAGALLVVSLYATGCNVEGVWGDRQAPGGPVVGREPSDNDMAAYASTMSAPVQAEEVDLVEAVAHHRTAYAAALQRLRDYYEVNGSVTKMSWAEFEIDGLQEVMPFKYLMDAEIAPSGLRPVAKISEADRLYRRGDQLMRRGGRGFPALFRQDMMVRAAAAFRKLIEQYPTSDKIDDAAFWLGEIHKEYLPNQESLAVKWYERSWTWDPITPHPARFQAATVYDYRLHDRDRALELYQQVVDSETAIGSNVRFAMRRIHELSQDQTAWASGR